MLRCVRALVLTGASLTLLFGALACDAQTMARRAFPATALRGRLVVAQPPQVLLNGEPARLAPGARIRAENNLVVLSGTLSGLPLVVHYTVDGEGQLVDVWILTPDELAKWPWPTTLEQAQQWTFDPIAQVWSR